MTELPEVLKRDFVYWDIVNQEIVLEKEEIRPDWSYLELRKGSNDWMITEYYKDGNLRLNFAYAMDTPKETVVNDRISLLNRNKGNWTQYMVTMPKEEFKKIIKQYYFGD